MRRVVLDTNIIVSACLTPEGAPATVVELALLGAFTLCLSSDVLAEYREVLARRKLAREQERMATVLAGLEEVALEVTPTRTLRISRDEEDNRLLECAEAAHADFLVTGNPKHFPARFENTRILSPRAFLIELGL